MVKEFAVFDAQLFGEGFPISLQIVDVMVIKFIVLFKLHLLLLESLDHRADFDQEFVNSFLLVEEWSVEGVADVHHVSFPQVEQFFY